MDTRNEVRNGSINEDSNNIFGTLTSNHALLERFQTTLQAHLSRICNQLEGEINNIESGIETLNSEREGIGANLYDLQREIEKQNDLIDSINQSNKEKFEKRIKDEDENRQIDSALKTLEKQYDEYRSVYCEKKTELRNVLLLERNVLNWHDEMQSEIEISKRMVSKDRQDKHSMTIDKSRMDLLLLNLELELHKRESENNELNGQIKIQMDVLQSLSSSLSDANTDLDIIQSEQKRLFSSWNDVVHAVENRDKVIARTKQQLRFVNQNRQILVL